MTKFCPRCKQEKDLSCFGVARRRTDGLQGWCRECRVTAQREWRRANPAAHAAQVAQDRAGHPDRFRSYDLKQRSTRTAAQRRRTAQIAATDDGTVDREAIYKRDNALCGICGELVDWADFELDHIVSLSAGGIHTASNVQVTHGRCNRRKHTKPVAELVDATFERM